MLVDDGLKLHGTSKLSVGKVNELPLVAAEYSVVYLTEQDNLFAPGLYLRSAGVWVVFNGADIKAGWWDDDATVVVDAANTVLGTGQSGTDVLTNHAATAMVVGNFDIVNNESRSNDNIIRLNASTSYILPNRIGATVPWTNEGNDWTVEYVFKHISGNGGLDINNFNSLSDRIQCSGGEANDSIRMQIFNNANNPKYSSVTSYINDGLWHHVAYTFAVATNTWKFWLDGDLKASTNYVPLLSTFNESISKYNGSCYLDRYQMMPKVKYTSNFTPAI